MHRVPVRGQCVVLFLGHHGVHGAPFCRHRLATNLFLFHYPRYGNVTGSLHDVGSFLRHRVLRAPAYMLAAVSASGVGDDHAFRSGVPIRGNGPSPVAACFLYGTFRGRVCADFSFGFPARGAGRDRSFLRFFDRLFPAVAVRKRQRLNNLRNKHLPVSIYPFSAGPYP